MAQADHHHQRQDVGHQRQAARHHARLAPQRAQREHEHPGHLESVGIEGLADDGQIQRVDPGGRRPVTLVGRQRAAGDGEGDKRHAHKEQAAAQADGSEELVFVCPQVVAHHADEPQEGNAGEGHQRQGDVEPAAGRVAQGRRAAKLGRAEADERHAGREQHGKGDTGNGRRLGRLGLVGNLRFIQSRHVKCDLLLNTRAVDDELHQIFGRHRIKTTARPQVQLGVLRVHADH